MESTVKSRRNLTPVETGLLRAIARVSAECTSRKSVVVLRYALLELNCWDIDVETTLCDSGLDHPIVAEIYQALCRLALETPFVDGKGDLRSPAGPRYTEVSITQHGVEYLNIGLRRMS